MAEPARPHAPAPTAAPAVDREESYHWTYGLLFQLWLVFFLLVICFALVNYLVTYIPK
ncbi:MAG: hypothetical protein K2P78_10275 [Gemmataceae bacterium]|nr:hypothetical protein [Gemmataceae bacterium]